MVALSQKRIFIFQARCRAWIKDRPRAKEKCLQLPTTLCQGDYPHQRPQLARRPSRAKFFAPLSSREPLALPAPSQSLLARVHAPSQIANALPTAPPCSAPPRPRHPCACRKSLPGRRGLSHCLTIGAEYQQRRCRYLLPKFESTQASPVSRNPRSSLNHNE